MSDSQLSGWYCTNPLHESIGRLGPYKIGMLEQQLDSLVPLRDLGVRNNVLEKKSLNNLILSGSLVLVMTGANYRFGEPKSDSGKIFKMALAAGSVALVLFSLVPAVLNLTTLD